MTRHYETLGQPGRQGQCTLSRTVTYAKQVVGGAAARQAPTLIKNVDLALELKPWMVEASKTLNSRRLPFPASVQHSQCTYVIPLPMFCTIARTTGSTELPTTTADCIVEAIACLDYTTSVAQSPGQSRLGPSQSKMCVGHAARTRRRSLFYPRRICRGGRTGTPDCRRLGPALSRHARMCQGYQGKAHGTRAARVRQDIRRVPRKHQNGPPQ